MTYSFNLQWEDLDEELREQKIDEAIEHNYLANEYADLEDDEVAPVLSLEDALENLHIRDTVEHQIRARFPIYF